MKVYASVKSINELRVNGGGRIISENSLATDNLVLGVAGSGSIDLDLKGGQVKSEVSGSGTLAIKGYASTNDIVMSGSGNLNAFDCELENATVKMSGSGVCEIKVMNTLDAAVLGSGIVKHKGNTKNLSKKLFGSGNIERAY
jgi:hypothetical protein